MTEKPDELGSADMIADRPYRIRRQRSKGWRMPPNAVFVGRPTKWGNPWSVDAFGRAEAIALYRSWLDGTLSVDEAAGGYGRGGLLVARHLIARRKRILSALPGLRGKNLACWCPLDALCHADVLLELANR